MKTKNLKIAFHILATVMLSLTIFVPEALAVLPDVLMTPEAGFSYAMTYIPISVPKAAGNPGVPGNKGDLLTIFDFDEVVKSSLTRDSRGVLIPQNIVMKPGKYMWQVYGTVNTIAPSFTGEGEPDAVGFIQAIEFSHPGQKREIKEFAQNNMNKNLGVILQTCDGSGMEVYGTPCATLQMIPTGTNNDTKKDVMFVFKARQRSAFVPADYEGTLTLPAVLATIAADEDQPDVANGSGEYQLTDNVAATEITTLNNAVNGLPYTLLGSGGANPASITAAGGDFLLANGTTWTGDAGSTLTVKAFKDGAASFKFIEVSRS